MACEALRNLTPRPLCSSYTDFSEVPLNMPGAVTCLHLPSLCPECLSLHNLRAHSFIPSSLLEHHFLDRPSFLSPALTPRSSFSFSIVLSPF